MQVFDRSAPFSPQVLAAVSIGGALGASARWSVGWIVDAVASPHVPGTWPWATLIVNLLGCVAIGAAAHRIDRNTTSWAFVVTGVLGGFTTFSAFAVELNDFAEVQRLPAAVLYATATLAGGVAATMIAGHRRSSP